MDQKIQKIDRLERHRLLAVASQVVPVVGTILVMVVVAGLGFLKFRTPINPTGSQSFLAEAASPAHPARLVIPKIAVNATFEDLNLKPDNSLQVPLNPEDVGWYINSAPPGQTGSSIVVGHLDSTTGPAVFYHLKSLQPGDLIEVDKADGSKAVFKVTSLQSFNQTNFPTQKVYGRIDYAGLRLITCDGYWDKKAGHYSNNLVVFAILQ